MKFPISRRFSRRGKLPAAAAYENHAAWRRSAAADNTVRDSRNKDGKIIRCFLTEIRYTRSYIRIFYW